MLCYAIHWKNWCWSWSWNSNILATRWEELTHWKRPWCWERLKAGGKGDNRGWDGWIASLTQWTWVFEQVPGVGDRQGSLACCSPWGHRVRHDWVTELNWGAEQSAWESWSYWIFTGISLIRVEIRLEPTFHGSMALAVSCNTVLPSKSTVYCEIFFLLKYVVNIIICKL